MKPNELMIGDWVYNTHNRKPEQVCEIMERMVMLDYNDLYDYDEIEPIPLTAALLERNGFKKFGFHDIVGQHQWSWWIDTLISISLWCRELNDDPKEGWMVRIESPLVSCCHKVEYVHELQQTLRTCKIEKEIKLED